MPRMKIHEPCSIVCNPERTIVVDFPVGEFLVTTQQAAEIERLKAGERLDAEDAQEAAAPEPAQRASAVP